MFPEAGTQMTRDMPATEQEIRALAKPARAAPQNGRLSGVRNGRAIPSPRRTPRNVDQPTKLPDLAIRSWHSIRFRVRSFSR